MAGHSRFSAVTINAWMAGASPGTTKQKGPGFAGAFDILTVRTDQRE
jgi:hypothetical protein